MEQTTGKELQDTTTYATGTDFMREKIKQRPLNRRRLFRRTLLTAGLAVIFGVVACATFLLLEPVFHRVLNPETEPKPDPVVFPEEVIEDEVAPEDLFADETELQRFEESANGTPLSFEAADIGAFYQTLRRTAVEASRTLVTVTIRQSTTGWSGESYERSDTVSGLIVADNGYQHLIVTDADAVRSAQARTVTFYNGLTAEAELLCDDDITGLCVLSVSNALLDDTIGVASLGSSAPQALVGAPVIAIGEPTGYPSSIVYGAVTSNTRTAQMTDANYALLSTDMSVTPQSNGILIDVRGDVVGLFTPALYARLSADEAPQQITAYGISAVRRLIEKLSNNSPRALLGVIGSDVPAEIRTAEEIPQGAYVVRVEMNTPAMASGIQAGDVIVRAGEAEIASFTALSTALLDLQPEEEVTLVLMRTSPAGYTEMTLTLTLASTSGT